ncbi:C-type lectin 37Db-like [Bactrocera tryoni]|uniref:C-type lectin 37Db-like n=1 Tax=Bactrocera tryoni TaxID=59916 RepID=UPI001A95DE81|nr:C-type lectin 37Db-like [Bactrocera tryoni]
MKQTVVFSAILVALTHCVSAGDVPSQDIASPIEGRLAPVEGERFILSLTSMNWFAAYGFCNQQNTTLLSLELGNADNKKKQFKAFINLYHLEDHEYWLYGSRLEDDVTFRWGLGGLPISYTDWSTGQPDNAGGQQRCMKLFKTILWDDDNCFSKYYAVCQKY